MVTAAHCDRDVSRDQVDPRLDRLFEEFRAVGVSAGIGDEQTDLAIFDRLQNSVERVGFCQIDLGRDAFHPMLCAQLVRQNSKRRLTPGNQNAVHAVDGKPSGESLPRTFRGARDDGPGAVFLPEAHRPPIAVQRSGTIHTYSV